MIADGQFWVRLEESLANGTCLGLSLSKRRPDASAGPDKLAARPMQIKGNLVYQWASRSANRESHENLSSDKTAARFRELFGAVYKQGHVFTVAADFELSCAHDGEPVVREGTPSKSAVPLDHNRTKSHLIPENVPCPFLAEIGVMTPAGKVRASKTAKFRQVNRFLELVNDILPDLPPAGMLRVVDFGCGKSYLTFALYHLLTQIHRREVEILGLERRDDVVALCSRLSSRLDCRGLAFRVGEISDQLIEGPIDLAVSLHACDTATDDALAKAVACQATAILAVPCCQHELSRTISADRLGPVHRHGLLHEQFASLATDALRAQALEACGYKTQVVEFVDPEHTAKNLLIRAIRRDAQPFPNKAAHTTYEEFKRALGLETIATDRILHAARILEKAN